ncbi:HAMP domain-containing histidine kinase [Aquabacterium sp. A7-Y]|uniref:sensor histidine kinase n=1 Tax=Aquabacterium sp. A7-Y TaxID=1349605 RepID=UPI00223E1367|nr:HAMP domain-containing sensor histidine kinase [Aquabacterium sp. A7-Y]MCW7536260.1 HAMP domain-containing histidine kinase [Aquabacterium sp. A7-Y]
MNETIRVAKGQQASGYYSVLRYGYSQEETAEAVEVTSQEDARWKWVTSATAATRAFAMTQVRVIEATFALSLLLMYLGEWLSPTIPRAALTQWVIAGVLILIVRRVLFTRFMFPNSPLALAQKPVARLTPLFAVLLSGAFWIATSVLFVGQELTPTFVMLLMVLVLMTVAAMGSAPVSHLAAAVHAVALWVPFAVQLRHATWAPSAWLPLLVVSGVALVLLTVFIVVKQVTNYLQRSDKVDLLVSELQEANMALEALQADVATELEARSSFFNGASHDFRQRLHAIKLLAHSSQLQFSPGATDSPLKRLAAAVEDLDAYVTDVLEFARLERHALRPKLAAVSVQDILQNIDLHFEEVAMSRRIDLRMRGTAVCLLTDETMLLRILENLVSNALKFARSRVLVSARRRAGACLIDVWDDGPGVPKEELARIFEAFHQGQQDGPGGVESCAGVGLGLAVVKRLSECLGYTIEVKSRVGSGTVMRVHLPATALVK